MKRHEISPEDLKKGLTPRGWLKKRFGPEFVEFPRPTVCAINGNFVLRKDWDTREIKDGDVVNFVGVVGEVATWVIVILVVVLAAVSVALALSMGAPPTPGELPSSHPVFSAGGKVNAIRLGEPIEVNYGRNRIYPSYASRPFFRYVDNEQYQHSLLCIGQGLYEIHEVQIGDTAIGGFEEAEYEILEPGEQTTLFHTNVHTSAEAGGQTLLAPNQGAYIAPGWVGPFASNPASTDIDKFEVDIALPKGLYGVQNDGDIIQRAVHLEIEYREIDDTGAPVGAGTWISFFDDNITKRTTTPQRLTLTKAFLTLGRYEVRMRRTSNTVGSSFGADQVVWEGLRGYIHDENPHDFGDVTLIAIKVRATNNLNSRTQERFNVIATRKLPIRDPDSSEADSDGWLAPQATRSIIWAFVDVFKSLYGARITDDGFFDWDALMALDATYTSRGEHFDFTFRDPITVWDAAKNIARVGRATPLLSGSLITLKRDELLEVPVTMFTPDNIIKGSFSWDIKLWEPNEFDSVSVEYTDPDSGYLQENVLCVLPGGTSDRPEEIRIVGIQDRDHAHREGLFYLAGRLYLRENFSFETGLEGLIPSYGDMVAIAHDVPRWAQHAIVLAVEDQGDGQFVLHLTEPMHFSDSGPHQVLLRGKSGEVLGPFDAAELVADSKFIKLTFVDESDIDWMLTGKTEPMIVIFGVIDQHVKYGRILKIEPQGSERVRITCSNIDNRVHELDDVTTPAKADFAFPDIEEAPVVGGLTVEQVLDVLAVTVSWPIVHGANYYIVEYSYDEESSSGAELAWTRLPTLTVPGVTFDVDAGTILVRVAGVGSTGGQGPWSYGEVTVVVPGSGKKYLGSAPVMGGDDDPTPTTHNPGTRFAIYLKSDGSIWLWYNDDWHFKV